MRELKSQIKDYRNELAISMRELAVLEKMKGVSPELLKTAFEHILNRNNRKLHDILFPQTTPISAELSPVGSSLLGTHEVPTSWIPED